MICPRCNSELNEVARDGVMIDFCNQCRGVWLDRGELDKLISRASTHDHQEYSSHHHEHHDSDEHYGHHKKKKSGIMDIFDIFG